MYITGNTLYCPHISHHTTVTTFVSTPQSLHKFPHALSNSQWPLKGSSEANHSRPWEPIRAGIAGLANDELTGTESKIWVGLTRSFESLTCPKVNAFLLVKYTHYRTFRDTHWPIMKYMAQRMTQNAWKWFTLTSKANLFSDKPKTKKSASTGAYVLSVSDI